jgi:hypothetical protein
VCNCQRYCGTVIVYSNVLWEMQSVTDSSYTGTVIVCTSAIAVLNWGLDFGNICLYMVLGGLLEREFCVLRGYILHVMYLFMYVCMYMYIQCILNYLQWSVFEKFVMLYWS